MTRAPLLKSIGLACALAVAGGLAGCGGTGAAPHVLRIADASDPNSLDPLLAHDQDTIAYDLLVCQTLVGLSAHDRLVPILVTRVPSRRNGGISPDGKTIVYHLKPNVRFADGTPLTSADVAFTYRAIVDPRNNVLSQDAYRRIVSLRTPDAHTVVVRLRRPWNAAVRELFAESDFAFGILPAHAFTGTDVEHAPWGEHPFGTGPFYVVDWRRGDRAILARNPYFTPRPKLKRIVLEMIPDRNAAFVALRSHQVDIAPLGPEMLAQARALPGLRVVRTTENATYWLSLQTQVAPTDELRVRRAIALALDLPALRKTFRGAYPLAGSFLPPVFAWHDAAIRPFRRNVAAAKALLRGRRPSVVLVLESGNQLFTRIATLVQQQLDAIGMRVTIKTFPVSTFNALDGPLRTGRFTISIDGWIGGADPEQSIVWSCSQIGADGNNTSRYCSSAFDALFADQQVTRSVARRRTDFMRMQRMVRADVPVVPLYYGVYFDGVDARVKGFERNMLDYPVDPQNWDTTAG